MTKEAEYHEINAHVFANERASDHSPVSQVTLAGHLSLEHHLFLGPQACPPLPVYFKMVKITLLLKQVSK